MGRFAETIKTEDNPFAKAGKTTKSAKDLGKGQAALPEEPVTAEEATPTEPTAQKPSPPKTTPKKPKTTTKAATKAPAKETAKRTVKEILPKEEKPTEETTIQSDIKRNPVISLNDPEIMRIRRSFRRRQGAQEKQERATASIYFTGPENELAITIAESYEMSLSELVRTLILNTKMADE